MLLSAVLIAAFGCDRVFELSPVDPDGRSAQRDSVPDDAECPPIGQGPPMFGAATEIIARNCHAYTISEAADLAVVQCVEGGYVYEEGPIEGGLSPLMIDVPVAFDVGNVWLAPEGDALVVRRYQETSVQQIAWYVRSGERWIFDAIISESTTFVTSGVPSAAPVRRLIESDGDSFRELYEEDRVWKEKFSPTLWSEYLGSGLGSHLNMSPDGLRLTFMVSTTPMYAERDSVDVPFGSPVVLESAGTANSAFMTADCGKLYYALGAIHVRRQQ